MTTTDRAQSLANARRACEWLDKRISILFVRGEQREYVECLIAEFARLDAKEQAQRTAGAKGKEFGVMGAEHGSKGGRPKGSTKGGKK